jgi:hypothetical protein
MKKEIMLVLVAAVLVSGVCAEMMISEIMYNPGSPEDEKEWIELYNNGTNAADISGWKLKAGSSVNNITFFRGGSLIDSDSFMILARNGTAFAGGYPLYTGPIFEFNSDLANTGKDLYLFNQHNEVMDSVNYTDIAKKENYTIELNGSEKNNGDMKNWIKGALWGNPGEIIKYIEEEIPPIINDTINETINQTIPEIPPENNTINQTVNETIPPTEDNQTQENNSTGGNNNSGVPEFSLTATIMVIFLAGLWIMVMRKN